MLVLLFQSLCISDRGHLFALLLPLPYSARVPPLRVSIECVLSQTSCRSNSISESASGDPSLRQEWALASPSLGLYPGSTTYYLCDLGEICSCSKPQFPQLKYKDKSRIYFIALINEVINERVSPFLINIMH